MNFLHALLLLSTWNCIMPAATPRIGTPTQTPKESRPGTPLPGAKKIIQLNKISPLDSQEETVPSLFTTYSSASEGIISSEKGYDSYDSEINAKITAVAAAWNAAGKAAGQESDALGELKTATDAAARSAAKAATNLHRAEEEIKQAEEQQPQLPTARRKQPCCRCCDKDCIIL